MTILLALAAAWPALPAKADGAPAAESVPAEEAVPQAVPEPPAPAAEAAPPDADGAEPVSPAAEEPPVAVFTLEDAIGFALRHNRDLLLRTLDVAEASLQVDRQRANVLDFSLTPEGGWRTGSDGESGSFGASASAVLATGARVRFGAGATTIENDGAEPWRRGEAAVRVEQPLFRGFGSLVRDEPVALADDALRSAARSLARARSALALSVVEAFEDLLYLAAQIRADEAFAARMERLGALAEAQERQGRVGRTEVLRMELQRGEAVARLEQERTELDIRRQSFADLVGLEADEPFELVEGDELVLEDISPEKALAVALRERPDYAQVLDDIRVSAREARLARRELLPDIRFVGKAGRQGEGRNWSDAGALDEDVWQAGLEADINIDRRRAKMAVAAADLRGEAAERSAEIARCRLALEVSEALMAYRRSRAEEALADRNAEVAEGRAELARVLFAAKKTGADAVSDAEGDCIARALDRCSMRREAAVAAYRVLHVLGTLLPADEELLERP
ncbi:MAG: TolC family protein [Kiritimatiellae bacterium]|nr:TolC family protein [Kiritimatiellia bacterium]